MELILQKTLMATKPQKRGKELKKRERLSIKDLYELSTGRISCKEKESDLRKALEDSSLYQQAYSGMRAFIQKEGINRLDELVSNGLNFENFFRNNQNLEDFPNC